MHRAPRNMYHNRFRIICIPLLAALIILVSGGKETVDAESTIKCHCFQNRIFDTDNPGAADTYYLATTHNAFYAEAGGASKKIIVRARQRGLHEDDLWIAFALSRNHSKELEQLLTTRLQHADWNATLKAAGVRPADLSPELKRATQEEASNITEEILVQTLAEQNLANTVQLQELRELNANAKEILASVLLQQYGKKTAPEYLRQARSGAHWDWLMYQEGIDIAQVEALWGATLNHKRKV